MSQMVDTPTKGFKVAAAIGMYLRVKPNASSQVAVAVAGVRMSRSRSASRRTRLSLLTRRSASSCAAPEARN